MSKLTRIALAMLFAVGFAPIIARAQQLQWTTIGSSGVLYYPTDPSKVSQWNGLVCPSYPNTGSFRWTYNLPVPPTLYTYTNTAMAVHFRDAGDSSDWIRVQRQEFDPTTGLTYTRMIFDSNSFTPSGWDQEGWKLSTFDFNPYKIYYLDAEIHRSSLSPPTPLLYSIRLWRY
jgi:hypothetical protein